MCGQAQKMAVSPDDMTLAYKILADVSAKLHDAPEENVVAS